ncbi:hypothetical protein C2S51_021402 [Perilla frutescens var. frutescens]|nr:hypothetical protein C2S51_021402 [Perilla frutescens var. frutescens]
MAMEREEGRFRILMFPWLAYGHISPFLELSKNLSKTSYFTLYLCSSAVNLDSIRASLVKDASDDAASVKLIELHVPPSPQLPPELHTMKNLPPNLFPNLVQAFQESSSSLSDIMDSLRPDLLVYDFFQPWAPNLASSKGIPSVYFSTSGATMYAYFHHLFTMGTVSTFPYQAIALSQHEMAMLKSSIEQHLKDADESFAFGNFSRSTDIVLVKSCREIELKYIDYLSDLSKKKMVCTGPLIADANGYDDNESSEIMQWLSGKDHSSTLYISFGSECILSKEQIAAIAKGLLISDVNFLWVVKFPVGERVTKIEEFPEGFVETVKDKGLVISRWAPQTKILGHPSIGGFVSHCGWSSIMESMYFGVPIITMPMQYDQPINAQMVVEAGVGVEVEKDGNGLYVGEEVAKAVNKAMVETTFYEGLRNRARRLSEAIREKEEDEVNEAAEQLLMICLIAFIHSFFAMERENHNFRILMFPWLAHGHISPYLELSKKLSKTNYFTIYLCSTAVNLDSIRASLVTDAPNSGAASVELVELHIESSPELPPELHTTKNLPTNLLPTLMLAFQTSSSSLSDIMDSVKPDLLMYDFFQPWAPKLASSKGIPSVYFLTSAATSFSYYHHAYTMGTGSTFPYKAISLPDSDIIKTRDLIKPYLKDADNDFAFGNFTRSSGIVLVKSCSEIELKYIDYLSALCKKKMVCTGPLIVDGHDINDNESAEIMKWLGGKDHSSTVYISFEEELPEGFLEKVKDKGLVISRWAPQTKILGHPSIGGFVSHCGWSSVVETMYFGVPVIAMPMRADQPLNAQLVVESGIGVGVEKDGNGMYVEEEVAKAINKVMVEKTFYEGLRSKARRLSETIKEKDEHEVNEAAEQLLMICMKNKKIV